MPPPLFIQVPGEEEGAGEGEQGEGGDSQEEAGAEGEKDCCPAGGAGAGHPEGQEDGGDQRQAQGDHQGTVLKIETALVLGL